MMRARRIVGGVLGGLVMVAGLAGLASAAAALSVSPPSGTAGQVLHAIGSGFPAGQQIKLQWDAFYLPETGSSGDIGTFDIAFAIPPNASPGGHVLRACIRDICSQAVPFTVSVVSGTPPPVATPSPEASAPPSAEPIPYGSAPPDGSSPSPAAPSDGVSPVPEASASAVAVPSLAPTPAPADPSAPGTVKTQFPWERIAIASVFALGVLLVVVAAANEKWLKGSNGKVFDRGPEQISAAGKKAPGKTPKLYEAMAKGTHAHPTPPSDLLQHEAAHTGDSDAAADVEAAAPAKPGPDAAKDVKLKGKKLKEN